MSKNARAAGAPAAYLPNRSHVLVGVRLLAYALIRNPRRFASQLMRGLDETGQVAERAGQVWAVAAIREIVPDGLPTRHHELNRAARSGGAEVFAANPEHSLTQLTELFDDSDRSVRQAAASAVRRLERLDEQQTNDLIEGCSPSYNAFRGVRQHIVTRHQLRVRAPNQHASWTSQPPKVTWPSVSFRKSAENVAQQSGPGPPMSAIIRATNVSSQCSQDTMDAGRNESRPVARPSALR